MVIFPLLPHGDPLHSLVVRARRHPPAQQERKQEKDQGGGRGEGSGGNAVEDVENGGLGADGDENEQRNAGATLKNKEKTFCDKNFIL